MDQYVAQAEPAICNTPQIDHDHRRTQRIEIRVTPFERAQLEAFALGAGYTTLAQYLRETGLHVGRGLPPTADYHQQLQWLQAINRIADHVSQIAGELVSGRQPDDDILYYLLQMQEMIEDIWQEARQEKGSTTEVA
jgi:hypothetical protein